METRNKMDISWNQMAFDIAENFNLAVVFKIILAPRGNIYISDTISSTLGPYQKSKEGPFEVFH